MRNKDGTVTFPRQLNMHFLIIVMCNAHRPLGCHRVQFSIYLMCVFKTKRLKNKKARHVIQINSILLPSFNVFIVITFKA